MLWLKFSYKGENKQNSNSVKVPRNCTIVRHLLVWHRNFAQDESKSSRAVPVSQFCFFRLIVDARFFSTRSLFWLSRGPQRAVHRRPVEPVESTWIAKNVGSRQPEMWFSCNKLKSIQFYFIQEIMNFHQTVIGNMQWKEFSVETT